jgi:site-specific recombinase XerD
VQHLAYMSINTRLSGILRFFVMNDYHLNIKKIRRYSIPEIQQILTNDIRSRVIVLTMCTTGCRIDALRELECGDISKISEYGIYRFWFYNRYRKHRYISYCTKECANAIDAYLSFRRKSGEQITDKSPLIREKFNIENPFVANAPKFISTRMIALYL